LEKIILEYMIIGGMKKSMQLLKLRPKTSKMCPQMGHGGETSNSLLFR
jgi:hypothetical protein